MMNKEITINKLRDIIEEKFTQEELEFLLGNREDSKEPIIEAFKDILRKKYKKLDLKSLSNKERMGRKITGVVADVYRDYVRDSIIEEKYYHAWKMHNGDLFESAQKDILNDFNYSVIKNKAFICHFTDSDSIATNIKSFLEFYCIPTFVDHDDGNKHAGGEWERTNERECKERSIFIVLVKNKPPTDQIKNEIDWDETERDKSHKRLRINLILEELSQESFNKFKIRKEKYQYIKHRCIENSCNDIFKSILNFIK